MRQWIGCVAGLALCPAAAVAQALPPEPATPEAWRAATIADVNAAWAAWSGHSPIPLDDENPAARAWLDEGRRQALARAETVTTKAGWAYTLLAYGAGFRDGHAKIEVGAKLPDAVHPGFVAAAAGDVAVVTWADPADPQAPQPGTRIRACDGEDIAALKERLVFPFTMDPGLAVDQRRAVPRIFFDRDNPFIARPQRCTFVAADGAEVERDLRWRAGDDVFMAAFGAAGFGDAAEWGATEPVPGVAWIGVPTFSSDPVNLPKLAELTAAVVREAPRWREGRAIVIDVRGNGGGSSLLADDLLAAIFPAEVLAAHRLPERRTRIDWRVSEGNIAWWNTMADRFFWDPGVFSGSYWFSTISAWSLRFNALFGEAIWSDGDPDPEAGGGLTARRPRGQPAPFPARVIFLTNGTCASACLDFADNLLAIPGVIHAGSHTSADSLLMEVRPEVLPSGLAAAIVPQKVYRGRARGAGEAYAPDLPHAGLWDDATVRAWLLAAIDAGL